MTDGIFIEQILFNLDQIVSFVEPTYGLFISWTGTGNLPGVIHQREKCFENNVKRQKIANDLGVRIENI